MLRFALSLLIATAGMVSAPVMAQLSQADRATIAERIAAFDTMMKEGRVGDSLDFVPPHLLETTAKKFGVPVAAFKASFGGQIATMMKDVKFVSFHMDLSAAKEGVTPDKSRTYLMIPTETVIESPATGRLQSKNTTLALKDGGSWYLVRVDRAEQIVMLREAYPAFEGIEFPNGSTTAVK
ncbi:hypothetical protein U1769_02275 [Sphingomonas sp. ZT3P38]|uniref:hypothetical protein n=1 Tax=Parasphingomonas zepuensis TaxID=3096161 RepID=UPI002FCC6EB5